jgi:hypothetical protein
MARETNPTVLLQINNALRTHPNLKYVFKSTLKSSLHNDFGCLEVTADFTDPTGVVFEPNSPKPARASKRTADPEIEGAYCAFDKTKTLRGDRYTITQPVNKLSLSTALTNALYINLAGTKYAWKSSKLSAEQIGELGGYQALLGIETVSANDRDLVWGATFPKPPKVKKTLADGSTFSSFCDSTKVDDAIAAGWSLIDPGLYTLQDLNNLLR